MSAVRRHCLPASSRLIHPLCLPLFGPLALLIPRRCSALPLPGYCYQVAHARLSVQRPLLFVSCPPSERCRDGGTPAHHCAWCFAHNHPTAPFISCNVLLAPTCCTLQGEGGALAQGAGGRQRGRPDVGAARRPAAQPGQHDQQARRAVQACRRCMVLLCSQTGLSCCGLLHLWRPPTAAPTPHTYLPPAARCTSTSQSFQRRSGSTSRR